MTAKTKKIRIRVKTYLRATMTYALVVYGVSICCSIFIANKFAKIADDAWWDQVKVSICIISIIYFMICFFVKKVTEKKVWIVTIDSNEMFYQGKKVRYYKLHRTVFQRLFKLCDLTLYDSYGKKICKLKNISLRIINYF